MRQSGSFRAASQAIGVDTFRAGWALRGERQLEKANPLFLAASLADRKDPIVIGKLDDHDADRATEDLRLEEQQREVLVVAWGGLTMTNEAERNGLTAQLQ